MNDVKLTNSVHQHPQTLQKALSLDTRRLFTLLKRGNFSLEIRWKKSAFASLSIINHELISKKVKLFLNNISRSEKYLYVFYILTYRFWTTDFVVMEEALFHS